MMQPEAYEQLVNAFRRGQPFQPFVIELDNGQRYIVRDPRQISGFGAAFDYEAEDGDFAWLDCWEVNRVIEFSSSESKSA